MAQPIQRSVIGDQEMALYAKIGNDLAGVGSAVPAVTNQADSGRYTKTEFNPQTEISQQQATTQFQQNLTTAQTGQAAKAQRLVDNDVLQASQADEAAQGKLREHLAQMMFASDNGTATFALSDPNVAKVAHRNLALQTLQANGINTYQIPEIG